MMENKNMNIMKISVAIIMAFAILSTGVVALGIAPSKKIIDYSIDPQIDGQIETINARIINTDSRDMTINIQASGELSGYITIPESTIHISSFEKEKEFTYYISLPKGLEPGTKTINIMASEVSSDANNALGGMMTVTQQVQVNVPYEGLHAQGYVSVSASEPKDPVMLAINIINSGTENIGTVSGMMDIKDADGRIVYSRNISGYHDISAGSSVKIEDSAKIYGDGEYRAEYTIYYDDKNLSISREFTLGDYRLSVIGVDVENFRIGTVARFDINISSGWNKAIDNAYGEVTIKDYNGKIVGTVRTEEMTIIPNNNSFKAYWDTENISGGEYIIGISIHAGTKVAAKEYPSTIKDDEIIIGSMPKTTPTSDKYKAYIAILLIIIALILTITLSRKSRRRRH